MRQRAVAAWILACVMCWFGASALAAEALPLARNLAAAAEEAREKKIPVMIAFTTRVCPYCRIARRDHLEPMRASEKWRDKSIMLDMQLDRADALIDFEGKPTDVRSFARRHGVRSVPTIIVFDADGKPASMPLVGLMSGDFYGVYIEQAIESGLIKMRYPQPALSAP